MPSLLKLNSYASYYFHPLLHLRHIFKENCHLGIQHQSQQIWDHDIREKNSQVPNLESILDRVPQSCSLLPFGCGIRKTIHNTKHCGGLALSSFVWCLPHGSHSPTVPSFPSAKIVPALGGQLRGFCMGDYCVWDGATNLLESLFIIMGPRT